MAFNLNRTVRAALEDLANRAQNLANTKAELEERIAALEKLNAGGGGDPDPDPGPGEASDLTNLSLPLILGNPVSGSNVNLFVGEWQGPIDHFDIEVVSDTGGTLFARQLAGPTTEVSLDAVVGQTLTLRVWAVNAAGETKQSQSAPFGPIAQGNQLVLAVAFLPNQDSPVPDVPFPVAAVYGSTTDKPFPQVNPNDGTLNWGWSGSTSTISSIDNSDPGQQDKRIQGRLASNTTATCTIELPEPGTYVFFAATSPGKTANFGVWAYAKDVANSLIQMGPTSSNGSDRTLDASGVSRLVNDWAAFSAPGGAGVEIEVPAPANPGDPVKILVSKSTNGGSSTPFLSYFAVFKKVA